MRRRDRGDGLHLGFRPRAPARRAGVGVGGHRSGTGTGGTGVSVTNPPTNTGDRCIFSDPDSIDCGGQLYNGQGITPDIYVVFDVSGSMATKDDGTTERIDQVRGALLTFLNDPSGAGIGAGIGYFGTQPLSCACTSCNPADYSTPAIPIAPLPGQFAALSASLAAAAPTGETPTGAALRGSCSYAAAYKQAHPGHDVVLLLVTDGEPQAPLTSNSGGCNPTLADATAAASSCLMGAVTIRTYVLGVGPSLQNLNQIAAAGGTSSGVSRRGRRRHRDPGAAEPDPEGRGGPLHAADPAGERLDADRSAHGQRRQRRRQLQDHDDRQRP